jgi:hypothetical protein
MTTTMGTQMDRTKILCRGLICENQAGSPLSRAQFQVSLEADTMLPRVITIDTTSRPDTIAAAALTEPLAFVHISMIGKVTFTAAARSPRQSSITRMVAYARRPLRATVPNVAHGTAWRAFVLLSACVLRHQILIVVSCYNGCVMGGRGSPTNPQVGVINPMLKETNLLFYPVELADLGKTKSALRVGARVTNITTKTTNSTMCKRPASVSSQGIRNHAYMFIRSPMTNRANMSSVTCHAFSS